MAAISRDQEVAPEGQINVSSRLGSLDLARGAMILLVIFVHSYGHNFVDVAGPGTISKAWDVIVSATKPIRMPAFFLISGFLAKSLVKRDWSVLLKKRVMFLMYMYIIWLLINQIVSGYINYVEGLQPFAIVSILAAVASKIVIPYSFLWFLWALSLYNVLTKATLTLPLWIVLGTALIISGFSEQLSEQPSFILRCGVYFILGARYPNFVTILSSRASWVRAAGLVVAYVASVGLILLLGEKFPGVWLPAGIIGSAAVITIATLVSPWPGLNVIKFLGRNTLQLYVLHPLLIGVLTFVELRHLPTMVTWFRHSAPMLSIHPIIFVMVVTAIAIMIWTILVRVGLGVLFELPWSPSLKPDSTVTTTVEGDTVSLTAR
jgi:uncharacterized membrane protein YcfT